jgi:trimethylamine--corrinoid protein Co-methyltransferase
MTPPNFEVLNPEQIQQIIDEAKSILMNPGVRVHNTEGLKILADAGVAVDFESKIVKLPETVIEGALDSTPASFDLYNLDGDPVIHYGEQDVQFDPGSTAIAILDNTTAKQRRPVTNDLVRFFKLVEMLPQLDAQSTSMVSSDVPEEIGDLYRLYLALLYMRKPIVTGAFRKDTLWIMKELLETAVGGDAALKNHPIAVFDVCPSPPLLWSDLTCQNLIDCSRIGIPAQLVSMPLAGATAPVTLAAAVVQHTAENLSGVVLHQLAQPGSPIVWGGSPAAFDMREGTTPMGAPETWLIDAAYVQIGRALNIPTHVYMGMSDSKLVDAQNGLESMGGAMVAALIGANMVSGAGMLDFESCQSLEKLVIDSEIIGLVQRLIKGIDFRDSPIASTLFKEMGHRGDYLSHSHTRKWFREEMYFPSDVIDRGSLENWEKKGSKTSFDRANDRVNELLKSYQPVSTNNEEVKRELRAITIHAAKKFGMQELPLLSV